MTSQPVNRRRSGQRTSIIVSVVLLTALALFLLWPSQRVTIGVEGQKIVTIAGPKLTVVPFTPGDALAVRIIAAEPTGDGFRYDLRYMAYGPGKHDLRNYLIGPDQRSPAGLPPLVVTVNALLPRDYSGKLFDTEPTPIDLHTHYNLAMALAWAVWGLLLIPLVLYGRKRRQRAAPAPPQPTIAERLRGLLEQAAHAKLTVEEQADLEKLLLTFWADRLNLPPESLAETLQRLRQHASAGRQVNQLERWLHSRAFPVNGAVARELLAELGWNAESNGRRGGR